MANTISAKVVLDGQRKIVLEYDILGDGSGEETDTVLIDFSTLSIPNRMDYTNIAIERIIWVFSGFSAYLSWDATTNVRFLELNANNGGYDFTAAGGPLTSNAGTGATGDVVITTAGLGAGDHGTIRIEGKKRQ